MNWPTARPRLAVLRDYQEEGWPSMDLCADMLLASLPLAAPQFAAEAVCPPFRRRVARLPGLARRGANADRLLNRFWDYPRHLRRRARDFDLFHLVDHSYSQLVHVVPAGRAGVTCQDLDTFRCLLEPSREPRPAWFRAMARHILRGLQKAAVGFYTSAAVRRQIEQHGLIDPDRLVYAPNGVAPQFAPNQRPDDAAVLPDLGGRPFLLHVGSSIPRKRIDVLLDVFAAVRRQRPDLRLVQVGGDWTEAQRQQISRRGVGQAVHQIRGLDRSELAALYRRAWLALQPSEAEGFGLPVVEALACGTAVIASDIPPLREVGGDAVVYCPVGDIPAWEATVSHFLDNPSQLPDRAVRLARAGQFSWAAQARTIAAAYSRLLDTGSPAGACASPS